MPELKRTPEPWTMIEFKDKPILPRMQIQGACRVVAEIHSGTKESKGNAILIIAAPQLLTACKTVLATLRMFANADMIGDEEDDCIKILNDAITKATTE